VRDRRHVYPCRRAVGYALSESPYGLIWPHGRRLFGTLGTVRQHPVLGDVNEARVVDDAGKDTDTGELLLRNPSGDARLLGHARGNGRRDRR
jgi:hypothetical protein